MQVKDGLACFCIRIDHRSISSAINALIFCHASSHGQKGAEKLLVIFQVIV